MVPIAFANAVFRELVLLWSYPEWQARQLSTVFLLLFFSIYIAWVLKRWPLFSTRDAMSMGLVWLALTLAFEFGLGYISGITWSAMLADYDLLTGRLWVLVPLLVLVAPLLFSRRQVRATA
ncbi:MAG TPA: hypothetical protein VF701_22255 [Thermoanaerobaculia bacterium]